MDPRVRFEAVKRDFLYHSWNQTQIPRQCNPTELLLSPPPSEVFQSQLVLSALVTVCFKQSVCFGWLTVRRILKPKRRTTL